MVPAVDRRPRLCRMPCLRRALETGQGFLEHYLPAYNFRETERGTEYKRDTAFPLLPKMWTRFDDEGYLDASEATDDEIFDLR